MSLHELILQSYDDDVEDDDSEDDEDEADEDEDEEEEEGGWQVYAPVFPGLPGA
jgi:hypothetical protein